MRIEWIVGLLGLVCLMTAGQEIQPDEITTEWFTTDAPVTMKSATDVTRPADREATALPPNDLRARILFNAEFEDDASQLAASQTGSTSPVGSTQLDNSLRSSTNNNDWTPIVWASTRLPLSSSITLPQATPLPSPVRQTAPAGPSTLIIRPTPLLRPVPTILATPGRVATPSSTEKMISSSIRPSSSTEAPIVSLPPISFQPSIVHFDLEDASSGPNFTIIADPSQINSDSIPVNQTAPLILADNSSLPAIILQDVGANDDDNVTIIATEQPVQIEEKSIVNITKESIPVNETILNETIVPLNLTANVTADEINIVVPDDLMGNSSFVPTQSSDNETLTIDEQLTREEEILTTPIEEDNSMTTDLSTSLNNDTIIILSNSSSAMDGGNTTTFVLSTTDMPLPSTSSKAASVSYTSVPVTTTVTSQPDDELLESTTDQELGNGNRQESGRSTTSTTLSALSSGLATLFPALTRPPSTTVIPAEINTKPITTTPPPPPTTTHKATTTSSIMFPSSSGWTIAPQQAPPTTTEYFPDNEWPSTEGSQADDYDSTTTIVAISVSIAVILCLAIAILLLLVLRRRRARAVQGTCQPARMDAYSLDNVSQSNTWQRGKVRNSLRASKRSYCNQAFDDSVIYIF